MTQTQQHACLLACACVLTQMRVCNCATVHVVSAGRCPAPAGGGPQGVSCKLCVRNWRATSKCGQGWVVLLLFVAALPTVMCSINQPSSLLPDAWSLLAAAHSYPRLLIPHVGMIPGGCITPALQLPQVMHAALDWLKRERAASELSIMMVVGLPNSGKSSLVNALKLAAKRQGGLGWVG